MKQIILTFTLFLLITKSYSQNHSAQFTGSGDYIQLNLDNVSEFTIEFWFKVDSPSSDMRLIAGQYPNSNLVSVLARNVGTKFYLMMSTGGSARPISPANLEYGEWYHIAISRVSNTSVRTYLNGLNETNDIEVSENWGIKMDQTIGGKYYRCNLGVDKTSCGSAWGSHFLNGGIDNFRIWSKPLTQQEISNVIYCSETNETEDLVLEYTFENMNENDVIDSSPNNNNGQLIRVGNGLTQVENTSIPINTDCNLPAPVSWEKNSNECLRVDAEDNIITKVSGGLNWNCGISSISYLPNNKPGYVSMKVNRTNQMFILGLTEQDNNQSYEEILYGLVLQQGTHDQMQANVFESGQNIGKKATLYIYDTIKIERLNDGKIQYKINDKLIYESNVLNSSCLIVDSSLKAESAQLENVKVSSNWMMSAAGTLCN